MQKAANKITNCRLVVYRNHCRALKKQSNGSEAQIEITCPGWAIKEGLAGCFCS